MLSLLKKTGMFLLLLTLLLCALSSCAGALDTGEMLEASGADSLSDALPDEAVRILDELGINAADGEGIFNVSMSSLFSLFKSFFVDNIGAPLRLLLKLLGIVILLCAVKSAAGTSDLLDMFGVLLVTVMTVSEVRLCMNAVITAIDVNNKFMLAFVPVFTIIVSVSGNAASALTYNSLVLGSAEIISVAANSLFVPLAGVFMSLSVAFSLNSVVNSQRLTAAINKLIYFFVGICTTLYTALLSLKNVMAVSVNTVASRGIRFVVSSMIPVVGSAISDAYSTLVGSLGIIKGSVAVFGIAAAAAINVPILLQTAMYGICLNLLSFAAESFGLGDVSSVFRCMSCTLKIVGVLLVLEMLLLVISTGIIVLMRSEM